MTVVYVDLLFLLNWTANYLLLLGAGRMAGAVLVRWRFALAAALGALYAVLIFLPGMGWLARWPCRAAMGVGMAAAAYGGERRLLRPTVLFFGASAGLAGAVLALELAGGFALTLEQGVFYARTDLRLLLVAFAGGYFVLSLFFRRLGGGEGRRLVRLKVALEEGEAEVTALVDTGHSLADPVTNRPVAVVWWECLARLLPAWADPADPVGSVRRGGEQGGRARLVPYRAVGVDSGLLLALRAKSVTADGRELGALLVALSPTPLDGDGGYQALIGGI